MINDRVQCTLCDTILEVDMEFGQTSCNCGNVYLVQVWGEGHIDIKCSRPDAVIFLDDDYLGPDMWDDFLLEDDMED